MGLRRWHKTIKIRESNLIGHEMKHFRTIEKWELKKKVRNKCVGVVVKDIKYVRFNLERVYK